MTDTKQIGAGLTVKFQGRVYAVPSVEAAAVKWAEFRDAAMRAGASIDDIGGGLNVCANGRKVARIQWNGRIQLVSA